MCCTLREQALFALAWLLNLKYAWEEAIEMHRFATTLAVWAAFRSYALSPTNWSDCGLVLVVLMLPPLMMVDSAFARSLAAIGMLLAVIKGKKVMRGSEELSFLVTMLVAILTDMKAFMVLLTAGICAFAYTFALLLQDKDPYDEPILALFTSYALLMHADGVGEADLYASSSLTTLMSTIYTLLLNIVMLNALIAIMGDTYDRVSETRAERGLLQRATLLVELEASMDKDDEV